MLWLENYKPKSFSEFVSHGEVISILEKYTLESIPNLIFHGQTGHNKKTTLYALIAHLYGTYPSLTTKTIEIEAGSTKLTVNYLESDEMVEISPAEYGHRDRYVVQSIIKEMAQTRPILGFFDSKKRGMRVLVIDQAEDLGRNAQAALRRTMEMYSDHLRIIMICTETSKLIEPIRSRCMLIRMRGFRNTEISAICTNIARIEGFSTNKDLIAAVYQNAEGNGRRALCIFELLCFNQPIQDQKRHKSDYSNTKLEWELKLEEVVEKIRKSPKPETMLDVRKLLYTLITSMIPPSIILVQLLKRFNIDLPLETSKMLSTFAIGYEERIRLGSKPLYHLEAFAASVMLLLSQKKPMAPK